MDTDLVRQIAKARHANLRQNRCCAYDVRHFGRLAYLYARTKEAPSANVVPLQRLYPWNGGQPDLASLRATGSAARSMLTQISVTEVTHVDTAAACSTSPWSASRAPRRNPKTCG